MKEKTEQVPQDATYEETKEERIDDCSLPDTRENVEESVKRNRRKRTAVSIIHIAITIVFILMVATIIGVWAYVCITTKTFVHFEASDVFLIATGFGGKALESRYSAMAINKLNTCIDDTPYGRSSSGGSVRKYGN